MKTEEGFSWASRRWSPAYRGGWAYPTEELDLGEDGEIKYWRAPEDGRLGRFIRHRLAQKRDVKVNITAISAMTGTGKTTLAMILAKDWHIYPAGDWNAEDYAFLDLRGWMREYYREKPGGALIMDEIEQALDRRNAMYTDQKKATHMLAQARFMKKLSIWTLPAIGMLEKRAIELSDIWIIVKRRGLAYPFYLFTNDSLSNTKTYPVRLHDRFGNPERIIWDPIDDDEDFRKLEQMKEEETNPRLSGNAFLSEEEVEELKEDALQESKREYLVSALQLKEEGEIDATQQAIGEVFGYSQGQVSKIKREYL